MAEETWRILISDEAGDAGGGGGGGGGEQISDTSLPPSQKHFFEQASADFSLWKPFLQVGGMLYIMYKNSSLVSTAMKGSWDILKAIMDVILIPLQPIVTKIFEALAPLVPKIAELSKAFLDPIVEWILPKLEDLLAWALDIDWTEQIAKWKEDGEKVVGVLESIWGWVAEKAWPKLTEWWDAIKGIWEGEDSFLSKLSESWSVIWTDLKPMAEKAWEGIKTYWNENIWPVIEDAWVAAKDFWDKTLLPMAKEAWEGIKTYWDENIWPVIEDAWTAAKDVWDDIFWAFDAYILTPVAKSWEIIISSIGNSWEAITNYVKDGWVYITETLVPNMFDKLGPGLLMMFGGPLGIAVGAIKSIIQEIWGADIAEARIKANPPPVFSDTGGLGTLGAELVSIWPSGIVQEQGGVFIQQSHEDPDLLGTSNYPYANQYDNDIVLSEQGDSRRERSNRNYGDTYNITFDNMVYIGGDDNAVNAFWDEVENKMLGILDRLYYV